MQTFKDKQMQFFKWDHLPESTLRRLEQNWPGVWQREIMPMIDERLFSELYCGNDGRASKATADMVALLILKEMEDLTDEETEWRIMVDISWQYALDMAPGEAYVAERTLQYFRAKLMASQKHRDLFENMTDRILAALGTRTDIQRKDSTHIHSNMARLSRLQLFVATITHFLRQLRDKEPKRYTSLEMEMRTRYTERESGRFGDARGSESKRRLDICASDANELLTRFDKSRRVHRLDGWRKLKRLFEEQCRVEAGGRIELRDDVSPESMQSPHDEGAGYSGHKGKGYQAQITETSNPENDIQVITHVAVESAAVSDAEAPVRDTEELEARGAKPDELICDTVYCGGDNDVALRDMGVELIGPAAGKAPGENAINIGAFETSFDLKHVHTCPRGHAPARVEFDPDWDVVTAVFDPSVCADCNLRSLCGVKRKAIGPALRYARCQMATAKRQRMEQTQAYKEAYAMRAGIEATNSELKRAHGLGRLRVRGQPAVSFAVYMKITACNVKRYIKARLERARNAPESQNIETGASGARKNTPYAGYWLFAVFSYRGSSSGYRLAA